MRLTVPVEKLDTHRSSPSKTMSTGLVMLVERSEAASVGVHHCCMKARLLARLMAPSCAGDESGHLLTGHRRGRVVSGRGCAVGEPRKVSFGDRAEEHIARRYISERQRD